MTSHLVVYADTTIVDKGHGFNPTLEFIVDTTGAGVYKRLPISLSRPFSCCSVKSGVSVVKLKACTSGESGGVNEGADESLLGQLFQNIFIYIYKYIYIYGLH